MKQYGNLMDEEELEDEALNEILEDDVPYTSITDRKPVIDHTMEGRATTHQEGVKDELEGLIPGANPVKERILQRQIAEFSKREQGGQRNYRNRKIDGDYIVNSGLAFAQAAQGANKPQINKDLYSNINRQNSELMKSNERELDRRSLIERAIAQRTARGDFQQRALDSKNSNFEKALSQKAFDNAENRKSKDKALAATGGNLPIDSKQMIRKLSDKNASIASIANQIRSTVAMLDRSKDDGQKLMQANQLLKTLNSTQGADAVGTEEAKRLGAFLQVSPIGRAGWMPGRDLIAFRNQAAETANSIQDSIKENARLINDLKQGGSLNMQDNIPVSGQSEFPKQIKMNGKVATVSNQSELDEAIAEGWGL